MNWIKIKESNVKVTSDNIKDAPFHTLDTNTLKEFDCNICPNEGKYNQYHRGIWDEILVRNRTTTQRHCSECNEIIPLHLLRGYFYEILEKPNYFKLLVTGKGTGKSMNVALFQIWYIMKHKRGHFVWVYRYDTDLLDKAKPLWDKALRIAEKKARAGIFTGYPRFNIMDWKNSRGEYSSAKGIVYNGERRIYFANLQKFSDTDSAFAEDALHYVFDEAMSSDGRYLSDEESAWAQIFNNVMRDGDIPTICWFLANPHLKGIWWMGKYTKPEWRKLAFAGENKRHFYEGMVDIELEDGTFDSFPCSLYQSPAERGKFGNMIKTARNIHSTWEGTYDEDADKYIKMPMPENYKPIYLVKDCIYARELKKGATSHQYFWYRRGKEEKLDDDVLHLCFSVDELTASSHGNKFLIDNAKELRYWVRSIFLYGLEENKNKPHFFTGEDDTKAGEAKNTILSFLKYNSRNFDKS